MKTTLRLGFTQHQTGAGFTLVELIIVITLIGILAVAVMVAINPGKRVKQARDATRKNDIGALATALGSHYTASSQNSYPLSLSDLVTAGDIKQLPKDPTANSDYEYVAGVGNSEAAVWATLENPTSGSGTWLWCWQSKSGEITSEVTAGLCTP